MSKTRYSRQHRFVIGAGSLCGLLSMALLTSARLGLAQSIPGSLGAPTPAISISGSTSGSGLEAHRAAIRRSPYGAKPVAELLQVLGDNAGGADRQLIFQALALRKQEALPLVKEWLKDGGMWEKHMLTKFLRVCPWPEATPELLALVRDDGGHWLPRTGALHALATLGEMSAGPEALRILKSSQSPDNLRLAAIAVVARLQYRPGIPAVAPFAQAPQIHLRLFAMRALAELGEPVDRATLLAALQDSDYVVRREATEALWAIVGDDVTATLERIAKSDFNEAVRAAAAQSLLRRDMRGHSAPEKVKILKQALEQADHLTRQWAVHTLLEEGQEEGRAVVEELSARPDQLGEQALVSLTLAAAGGKPARTP